MVVVRESMTTEYFLDPTIDGSVEDFSFIALIQNSRRMLCSLPASECSTPPLGYAPTQLGKGPRTMYPPPGESY